MTPVSWNHVRATFERALDLPVAERAEWVRREASGSDEPRRKEKPEAAWSSGYMGMP